MPDKVPYITGFTFGSVENQKRIWKYAVEDHSCDKDKDSFAQEWGVITDHQAKNTHGKILGDYAKILKDYLLPNIKDKVIIDLGCLDGKWTVAMQPVAKYVYAVDITSAGFERVRERTNNAENVFCHVNSGYDLCNFVDESVDYIFSMDSLVRSEVELIDKYLGEFKRVLRPDGQACIHLPCQEQPLSHQLGFTQFDIQQLQDLCKKHGIDNYRIDRETINHGVLLLINIK